MLPKTYDGSSAKSLRNGHFFQGYFDSVHTRAPDRTQLISPLHENCDTRRKLK